MVEALRLLADSDLRERWIRGESTWPSLTEAVHWLVDDTGLGERSASSLIPQMLANMAEADAVDHAVAALLVVLDALGPLAADREYVVHPAWPDVADASREALNALTATQ